MALFSHTTRIDDKHFIMIGYHGSSRIKPLTNLSTGKIILVTLSYMTSSITYLERLETHVETC